MTIAGTYLVETDLNNRLTAALLVKVYDDDENGAADEAVVNAAIKDAEDDVEQRLAKIYGEAGLTAVRAKGPAITRTVKKLCLDSFECRMGWRHPEYVRGEWDKRWKRFDEAMQSLADRRTELADLTGDIEPAVNEGGYVRSGNPDDTDPVAHVFLNDDAFGVFR